MSQMQPGIDSKAQATSQLKNELNPITAEAMAHAMQEEKIYQQHPHYREQIIHRSKDCIIVANTNKNSDPDRVSYKVITTFSRTNQS